MPLPGITRSIAVATLLPMLLGLQILQVSPGHMVAALRIWRQTMLQTGVGTPMQFLVDCYRQLLLQRLGLT